MGEFADVGNERLELLALADACSRGDGTGCWPTAATIARKANISDRTVRRVIARWKPTGTSWCTAVGRDALLRADWCLHAGWSCGRSSAAGDARRPHPREPRHDHGRPIIWPEDLGRR